MADPEAPAPRPPPPEAAMAPDVPTLSGPAAGTWGPNGEAPEEVAAARPITPSPPPAAPFTLPAGVTPEAPHRYTEGPSLGQGGMALVRLVHDQHLDRDVAMKQLRGEVSRGIPASSGARARFLREGRVLARLEHPNIVAVHELGQRPDGTLYYTMRRVQGRSLDEVIAEATTLAARLRLLPHVVAVAHALAFAHTRGVVHRDVKPANVMVGPFGETLLLDWGLARLLDEPGDEPGGDEGTSSRTSSGEVALTQAGAVLGSPQYLSPEQARGEPATPLSDVWALGALLHQLLTGRPPRPPGRLGDLLTSAASTPVPPLRRTVPDVAPDLAAIADRALAMDPAARYPGAAAFAEDLEAWAAGRAVSVYRYSLGEAARRFVARNRVVVGVSVGAALALFVGGAVAVANVVDARDSAVAAEQEARAQLLEARRAAARAAHASGDALGAALLAADVLQRGEDPEMRGLVLRGASLARPRLVAQLTGGGPCWPAAWRGDGRAFACSGRDGVWVWDPEGHPLDAGPGGLLDWTGDGRLFVLPPRGPMRIAGGEDLGASPSAEPRSFRVSRDGRRAWASQGDGCMVGWERAGDAGPMVERWRRCEGTQEVVMALSVDEALLAWGSIMGTTGVLVAATGEPRWRRPWSTDAGEHSTTRVGWSSDGRVVASADEGELRQLDAADGATVASVVRPGLALLGEARFEAWASHGDPAVLAPRWGRPFRVSSALSRIVPADAIYAPGERLFALPGPLGPHLWERGKASVLRLGAGETLRAGGVTAWGPRGVLVPEVDGSVGAWNVVTGLRTGRVDVGAYVPGIEASTGGGRAFLRAEDGAVWAWDPAAGVPATRVPLPGEGAHWNALSPDGSRLAVMDRAGWLNLLDATTFAVLARRELTGALRVRSATDFLGMYWCAGDTLVATGADGMARALDGSDLSERWALQTSASNWDHLLPDPADCSLIVWEGGTLHRLDRDGRVLASSPSPGGAGWMRPLGETLLVDSGGGRLRVRRRSDLGVVADMPADDLRIVMAAALGTGDVATQGVDQDVWLWDLSLLEVPPADIAPALRDRWGIELRGGEIVTVDAVTRGESLPGE